MAKKTNILHVRMTFTILLAEEVDSNPVTANDALLALDGAAMAVATMLPANLRTGPDSVVVCEGARVRIGLDKAG